MIHVVAFRSIVVASLALAGTHKALGQNDAAKSNGRYSTPRSVVELYHDAVREGDYRTIHSLSTSRHQAFTMLTLTTDAIDIMRRDDEFAAIFRRHKVDVGKLIEYGNSMNAIDSGDAESSDKRSRILADCNKLLPNTSASREPLFADVMAWFSRHQREIRYYQSANRSRLTDGDTAIIECNTSWEVRQDNGEWQRSGHLYRITLARSRSGWQIDLDRKDLAFWMKYIVAQ